MVMYENLSALRKEELLARRQACLNDITRYNSLQLATKVKLNSAYGAL